MHFIFISLLAVLHSSLTHVYISEGTTCITKLLGEQGTCRLTPDCPQAIYRQRMLQIKPEICSFNGYNPLICCVSNTPDYSWLPGYPVAQIEFSPTHESIYNGWTIPVGQFEVQLLQDKGHYFEPPDSNVHIQQSLHQGTKYKPSSPTSNFGVFNGDSGINYGPLVPMGNTDDFNGNREGAECITKTTREKGICSLAENCSQDKCKHRSSYNTFSRPCGFINLVPLICCVSKHENNIIININQDSNASNVNDTSAKLVNLNLGNSDNKNEDYDDQYDQYDSLVPETDNEDRILNVNGAQQTNNRPANSGTGIVPVPLRRRPGELSKSRCDAYYPPNASSSISGGQISLPRQFPHMAALGYGDRNSKQWLCGGSLISKKFVLTAAHCVSGSLRYIRLGDLNLFTDDDDAQPQDFDVARTAIHPAYRPPSKYHDIALVELDREIQRTEYVSPACLYLNRQVRELSLVATGWGKTGFSEESSDVLLKVNLNLASPEGCARIYGVDSDIPNGIINDFQVCAGGTVGQDTCMGDSGGPLQFKDLQISRAWPYNVHRIVGITSFGKACGVSPSPGVYTRVSRYIPWIETIAWQNETD